MWVICKDISTSGILFLTKDQKYFVEQIREDSIDLSFYIKDDTGEMRWYRKKRFISVDESRLQKLKSIGI
jgi:hypothetical protein